MNFIGKIKIRLMNFFKPYIIYKIGDKFAVKGTQYSYIDNNKWVDHDGVRAYWGVNDTSAFINSCKVSSCKEAHEVINKRIIHIDNLKRELEEIKREEMKPKIAYECYDE